VSAAEALDAAPLITLQSIHKTYRLGELEVHALRGVDLRIDAGEFVAIMGPSGSGKTTLMEILGCLSRPTLGHYVLNGRRADEISADGLARLRGEEIGFVFQSFNLIPDLPIYANVEVPLRYRGMGAKERRERIERALSTVGLTSRLRHLPTQLSGGQQQRVAIARALAGEPRILLADEPTGNLDSVMARQVMDLLHEIHDNGTTIIMVTHDPELASRAQRNIRIFDGEVSVVQPLNTDVLVDREVRQSAHV